MTLRIEIQRVIDSRHLQPFMNERWLDIIIIISEALTHTHTHTKSDTYSDMHTQECLQNGRWLR